jgi:hypothetical protein
MEQRQEAERTLDALGTEGLEALLNIIATEEKKRKQNRKQMLITLTALYAVLIAISICIPLLYPHFHLPLGGILGGASSGFVAAAFAISSTQQNATLALTRYNDVRATGALTMGLAFQDTKLRQAAEQKLVDLLPRMHASDTHLLNEIHRAALNKQLDRSQANPALVKAILLAWQQVGDEKALPHVESLSRDEKRPPAIRQAAADCLPFLQQRVAEMKMAQTLLRASDSGEIRPGELLRAAYGVTAVNPSELLRADAGDSAPLTRTYDTTAAEDEPVNARHS